MSTRRTIADFPRNEAGLVDEFIGTAYDVVKEVHDNLPEIQRLDDVLQDIENVAENVAQAAIDAKLPEFQASIDDMIDTASVGLDAKVATAAGHATAAAGSATAASTSATNAAASADRAAQETTSLLYVNGQPLTVQYATQFIYRAPDFYRVKPGQALPLTLTGDWSQDADKLGELGSESVFEALAEPDGSDKVAHGDTTVGAALFQLLPLVPIIRRENNSGMYNASPFLPGFRLGGMVYAKDVMGGARLITDISHLLPKGAFHEARKGTVHSIQIPLGTFSTTGNATVFRKVDTNFTGWSTPGGIIPPYTLVDLATGRRYGDLRQYPASDYSANVEYSSGFAGLMVEIKLPVGVSAPTTLALTLHYPATTAQKAVFIDPVNGHDRFDGSSMDWPMKTITAAIARKPDVIYLTPTLYTQGNFPATYTAAEDIAIRSYGGRSQFVSMLSTFSAWTSVGSSVYSTVVGGSPTPVGCVDLKHKDEYGLPYILKSVPTLAECATTPNSFYYDGATRTMNVHLIDGSAPDAATVTPYGANSTLRHSSATAKVYVSDIDFIGGTGGAISARDAGVGAGLIADRCRFLGNYNSNGADIKDIGYAIFRNCMAAYNLNDGFNYTKNNSLSPHFLEINCVSIKHTAGGTTNGSTSHDSSMGLRIGTDVRDNSGPGIVDVGDAITYNVNCMSNMNNPTANADGFRADGVNCKMYLDGVSAMGNAGVGIQATNGATIYMKDSHTDSLAGTVLPLVTQ